MSTQTVVAVEKARPWKSYAAALIASLLWASLYPAGKLPVAVVGPVQVALCRVVFASLTLGLVVIQSGFGSQIGPQLRLHWRGIIGVGLVNYALSSLLSLVALGLLPASMNSLLNNTYPLWLAVGTALLLRPPNSWRLIGGSVLAIAGLLVVLFPDFLGGSIALPTGLSVLGVAVSLTGSGVIAVGTVIARRVMPSSNPLVIAAMASWIALPAMFGATEIHGGLTPIFQAPLSTIVLLIYVGIGCTAINFALWFYALQRLPAAQASAIQYVIPPAGIALSAVFLGEPVTTGLIIGTVLILAGVVAAQA